MYNGDNFFMGPQVLNLGMCFQERGKKIRKEKEFAKIGRLVSSEQNHH
jgi:hypothetical protein